MKLIVHTDIEYTGALASFPYLPGQFGEDDGDAVFVVHLGDRTDTTAAQEQFLDTSPAVVSYQVSDEYGCANGTGICPAAIDAAPRDIQRGTIIECPRCKRHWQGDYWQNKASGVVAWSWRGLLPWPLA